MSEQKGTSVKHRLVLLLCVAAVACMATAPSAAFAKGLRQGDKPPTLLTGGMSGVFAERPAMILTLSGATTYQFIGQYPGKGGRIHWQTWTRRAAHGVGIMWTNDCIPSTADGTWHGCRATIDASRVRGGRFTRMVLRYREGGEQKTWRRVLSHAGGFGNGWFWS